VKLNVVDGVPIGFQNAVDTVALRLEDVTIQREAVGCSLRVLDYSAAESIGWNSLI